MGAALVKGMLNMKATASGDKLASANKSNDISSGDKLACANISDDILSFEILAYDIDAQKLNAFCSATGARAASGNAELAGEADIVVLAVKPDAAPGALRQAAERLSGDKLLISIVLGLSLGRIAELTEGRARYVRCMPNTPALVNEGMTCVSMGSGTDGADIEHVAAIFGSVGKVEFMQEKDLEKVTALTGSSPAYIFVLIEAMADAAVLSGLQRATAYKLASQAVLGSAKMVLETGMHPGALKDMVCSPAGSTIEAIRVLEGRGFRSAVIEAMRACDIRAGEISKQ